MMMMTCKGQLRCVQFSEAKWQRSENLQCGNAVAIVSNDQSNLLISHFAKYELSFLNVTILSNDQ